MVLSWNTICSIPQLQNLFTLRYIENDLDPTDKYILKRLLKQNGRLIQHVDHQTYELCLISVHQNSSALEFIFPTNLTSQEYYNICLSSVRRDGFCLRLIQDIPLLGSLYTNICIEAVSEYTNSLIYVKDEFMNLEDYENVCMEAIRYNSASYNLAKHKTERLHQYFEVWKNIENDFENQIG